MKSASEKRIQDSKKLVLELRGITKIFPGIVANDKIDFNLLEGEIHSILGENGAGKSTLMNIIAGLYQQDSGEIFVFNKNVNFNNDVQYSSKNISYAPNIGFEIYLTFFKFILFS